MENTASKKQPANELMNNLPEECKPQGLSVFSRLRQSSPAELLIPLGHEGMKTIKKPPFKFSQAILSCPFLKNPELEKYK